MAPDHLGVPHHRQEQSSWWRRAYNRLSHTSADEAPNQLTGTREKSRPKTSPPNRDESSIPLIPEDYDEDLPPPSLIRSYRRYDHREAASPSPSSYANAVTSSGRKHTSPSTKRIGDPAGPAHEQRSTFARPYQRANIVTMEGLSRYYGPASLPVDSRLQQDDIVASQHPRATNQSAAVNVQRSDSVLGRLFVPTDAGHSFAASAATMTAPTDSASDFHTYRRVYPTSALPGLDPAYLAQSPQTDSVRVQPTQGTTLQHSQVWLDSRHKRFPDTPIFSAPRRLPRQIVLPALLGNDIQSRRMHEITDPTGVPQAPASSSSASHLASQRMELPRQD